MLDIIEVARLEEARIARGVGDVADEVRAVGGVGGLESGLAARGTPGLWVNMAMGVGMKGAVAREELEGVARWYEEKGIEPRFEVCPYADGSVVEGLGSLGFVVKGFESVLFREVGDGGREVGEVRARAEGLAVEVVDPGDAAMVRAYAAAVVPQFLPKGVVATGEMLELTERCVRHPRTVAFVAKMDGRVVGGGGMEVHEDVAALFGLAVEPAYRRRGIQTAIMAERLRVARERGVRVATIGVRPGAEASGTERNARRAGFEVGYTKVLMVRPGEGLMGVVG